MIAHLGAFQNRHSSITPVAHHIFTHLCIITTLLSLSVLNDNLNILLNKRSINQRSFKKWFKFKFEFENRCWHLSWQQWQNI